MKTIFIHGGSRGSLFINGLVKEIAPRLLATFKIHHQTGRVDYSGCLDYKKNLPKNLQTNYVVEPYLVGEKWVKSLLAADLVVSRAGANVCSELATLKKPAVLIPLRYSYLNEQYENALALQKMGGVEMIEQKNTTVELLYQMILKMNKNLAQYQKAYENYLNQDLKAAENLLALVLKVIQK
ncbi:hypothetical protein A2188_01265 [Candidatus Woesebacteria bacterium RIFOXYA1_FULL_43_9]|uniref:Glycosyl transferase family 28 C-terminal domain-containing protein n=1 Tax=Candidatus Woesebacteria bacterium RIFOXYA1_FULL_43_9 TaxID=1802534 RepID=A0A1F8CP03_9BACT|nr:MAG: hypothetical protein A2188_01265 [Candidatus Woesebacteria bacterium RIFOXYA1_FULL_43_9]